MSTKQKSIVLSLVTAITFLAMIVVNSLASILPINGMNTGQISDSYRNLFAPAGVTFAIWGVIYIMLALFTLFIAGIFREKNSSINYKLQSRTAIIFSISSLANTAWIFAWQYKIIPISMLLITAILVLLIIIMQGIDKEQLTKREKIFIKLPFSIYFGWITVATIANATVLLVSLGWTGFGISQSIWTIIILVIGTIIGVTRVVKVRDVAYGLVFIWAYTGILIKHTSSAVGSFDGKYIEIIITLIFCLAVFLIVEAFAIFPVKEKTEE